MISTSEKIPYIDIQLIEFLEKAYKQIQYDPEITTKEFVKKLAFNAGCLEVVNKLRTLYNKQRKN